MINLLWIYPHISVNLIKEIKKKRNLFITKPYKKSKPKKEYKNKSSYPSKKYYKKSSYKKSKQEKGYK